MPGLNGIEVAGILRRALPRIRIVLVTMFAEDIEKSFASFFRIDAVVSKVGGLANLTAVLTNILANEQQDSAAPGEARL
jgi:DNA-binding NarL/FixJ family response regulator